MTPQCFYCEDEVHDGSKHHVTFVKNDEEMEHILCDGCYFEWLEGIKG